MQQDRDAAGQRCSRMLAVSFCLSSYNILAVLDAVAVVPLVVCVLPLVVVVPLVAVAVVVAGSYNFCSNECQL